MSHKIVKDMDWMELTSKSLDRSPFFNRHNKPSQGMYDSYQVASTRSPHYCCQNKSPYGRWLGQVPPKE